MPAPTQPITGTITWSAAPPDPEHSPPPPRPAGRGRKTPPSTVRLHEEASAALWEAFVRAKQEDPFLTYTAFASGVVEAGLAS